MRSHEKYIERNDLKDATHLEISVYYDKGGANFLSGDTTPRGFYLSVKPASKLNGVINYMIFSGLRHLLFEAKNFTARQLEFAVAMSKDIEDMLIAAVVKEHKAEAV